MRSICYVSETGRIDRPILDPSVRYRCFHPGELLGKMGRMVAIYSAARFYDAPCLDYDVYIFHRPNVARKRFSQTVGKLKFLGKTLLADYDDLIFGGEELALVSSAVKNGTLSESAAITAFGSNLEALGFFDLVTTSTKALAEKVLEFNPSARVNVLHNFIPPSVLEVHDNLDTSSTPRSEFRLGYFSGTKSHNSDFPIVSDVLHKILSENRKSSLLVVGPVDLPPGISSLPNVTTLSAVGYWRLPSLMKQCSIVIAPLEETSFNRCKSRVKYLESALAGCRLVASPIPDMSEIGSNFIDLASSKNDWYNYLSSRSSKEELVASASVNKLNLEKLTANAKKDLEAFL